MLLTKEEFRKYSDEYGTYAVKYALERDPSTMKDFLGYIDDYTCDIVDDIMQGATNYY